MTTDFTQLDADIENYISSHELAPRTLKRYDYNWNRWQAFCEQRGFPALDAPWEAYELFWLECVTGRMLPVETTPASPDKSVVHERSGPVSMSTIDQMLAAIAWAHKRAGRTPAFQQPEYANVHKQIRAGYERKYAPKDVKSAKPLRPEDVRVLNAYEPGPGAPGQALMTSGVFLSLDLGWKWDRIKHFTPSHVRFPSGSSTDGTSGHVIVTDPITDKSTIIDCTCGPIAPEGCLSAIPRVCLACILRTLHTADPETKPINPPTWRATAHRITRNIQHLTATPDPTNPRLTYSGPDDDWARSGTRLALLEFLRGGLPVRSAQARMSISWPIGLRSDSDAHHLRRRHVTVQPDGSLTVRLPQSKGDQKKKGTDFAITTPITLTSTTGRVIQWLAIVDALTSTGPNAPVFPALHEAPASGTRVNRSNGSAASDFRFLQTAAGLTGFSLHSTRTGFAVTATEAGHSQSDIQDSMRLKQTRDLIRYTREAHALRGTPVEQLIQELLNQGAA